MGWGSLEFGQSTSGIAPEAISMVNDTTTLIAAVAIIVLLLLVVVFLLAANYTQTGSPWDFGSKRRGKRRRSRRK